MMSPDDFRRIALGMAGAIEASHMNHPDFRANGKIFATISPDPRRGMVSLTPDQQREFLRTHPAMFEPAAGAWGRQGATMVHLAAADPEVVGEAMTLAWQRVMAAPPPRRKPAARPAVRPAGRGTAGKAAPGRAKKASARRRRR
jgi:hypothetical protein